MRTWTLAWLQIWAICIGVGCRAPDSRLRPPSRAATQDTELVRLTLLATNDLHGWVSPHVFTTANGVKVSSGGLAAFKGYVDILREENPGGVLLLDSGDLFQGTLVSNLTEGEVVIDALNHLGYTAAAIGNHEFDYGPTGPVSVAHRPGLDPFGALKARIAQAKFPLLASNIYDAQTGERPTWLFPEGLTVVEVKGIRVGLVGLLTPTTPTVTNPVNVSSLRFGSLAPELEVAARALRARGAEILVAMVHAGGRCQAHDNPRDTRSCDLETGEIFEAVRALPARTFDAVLAGHTHQVLGHFLQDTPIVETSGLGRSFSVVELFINPRTKVLERDRTVVTPAIPICAKVDKRALNCDANELSGRSDVALVPTVFRGKTVQPDALLERKLQAAQGRVDTMQKRPLGLTVPLSLERHYEDESALGSFLADSLRDMEKADVALLNSGGLRSDLKAGEVTYGAVYEVLPFDNTVATVEVTGEELGKLVMAAYGARKGVFQVSGLEVELSRCPGHDRVRGLSLPGGRPLRDDARYKVVMPDFLARGGDGLGSVLAGLPQGRLSLGEDRELNFRDALVAYWQAQKSRELRAPPRGRIRFLDDAATCGNGP